MGQLGDQKFVLEGGRFYLAEALFERFKLEICKTELANSQNWPIAMYRTTGLANFARLANSMILQVGDTFLVFWSTYRWSSQFLSGWAHSLYANTNKN